MLVKDIMTRNVITVRPSTTLKELVGVLKEHRINGVPVVGDDGTLEGVITMTDLLKMLKDINYWSDVEKVRPGLGLKEAYTHEKETSTVSKKMTKQVSTVSEDDPVEVVLDLMCRHNVHTIPVVANSKLIGVVGAADIVGVSF